MPVRRWDDRALSPRPYLAQVAAHLLAEALARNAAAVAAVSRVEVHRAFQQVCLLWPVRVLGVGPSVHARCALEPKGAAARGRDLLNPCVSDMEVGGAAQGLRAALEATMRIKGLLEMMFDKLSGWIDEFINDMEARLRCMHAAESRDSARPALEAQRCCAMNTEQCARRWRAQKALPAQPRRLPRGLPRPRAAAAGRQRRTRPHMSASSPQQVGSIPCMAVF